MGQYDILWKGMLEEVFVDLMRFLFPDIDKELDLERGVEFLDKELGELYPEPGRAVRTREVDKLVKVHTRAGGERWMLLHLEVQGWEDKNFARRMFQYYYRILDHCDRPVSAVAIFTGVNRTYMPDRFEERCLGTRIVYEYNTRCILDYTDEELQASDNIFAVVMLVAKLVVLKKIKNEDDFDAELLERKMAIVRILQEKKKVFGEDRIGIVYSFLNNYIVFKKPETNRKFGERVGELIGKTSTMGYFEVLAQVKVEEATEKTRAEERKLFVENLLTETKFSVAKIASLANVTVGFVNKVKRGLQSK